MATVTFGAIVSDLHALDMQLCEWLYGEGIVHASLVVVDFTVGSCAFVIGADSPLDPTWEGQCLLPEMEFLFKWKEDHKVLLAGAAWPKT